MKNKFVDFIKDYPYFSIILVSILLLCANPIVNYVRIEMKYNKAIDLVNEAEYDLAYEMLTTEPLMSKGRHDATYYKDCEKIANYAQAMSIYTTVKAKDSNDENKLYNYKRICQLLDKNEKIDAWTFSQQSQKRLAEVIKLRDKYQSRIDKIRKKEAEELAKATEERLRKEKKQQEQKTNKMVFTRCSVGGCSNDKVSGSSYCVSHTCKEENCVGRCYVKNSYCSIHKCNSLGCKDRALSNGYCKYCKPVTTSKKKTSGSKKYKMPDCDDYDSYDDFMDDWDGYMPDGSDAEDYWENW